MSICKKMKTITEVSRDSRDLKFRRRSSKSGGMTSPLASEQIIVNKVDGKTLCSRLQNIDMDHRNYMFQRPEGAYYSDMSKNLTPENRQRMQPWLESRINSRDIKGLEWLDKDQKIFKVPWKHVGNREWQESDGIIFREWAIHTGRFREGVDQPDWPTWKTRFRCALTKLPGIEELKQFNQLDGQTDEPYRVYKFVPKKNSNVESITFSPPVDSHYIDDSDSNSQHSQMDYSQESYPPSEPTIPTVVLCETGGDMSITDRLPSDIQSMDSSDLIQIDSAEIRNLSLETGGESFNRHVENPDFIAAIARKPLPGQNNNRQINVSPVNINVKKMLITIKYLQMTVYEDTCSNPSGCRLFFAKNVNVNQGEFEHFFGPADVQPIPFPICNLEIPAQVELTRNILNTTDRGVVFKVGQNGNIYATRKCRCRIYVSMPTLDNTCEIIRLERDNETLVYDLTNYYLPALQRYLHEEGPKPFTNVVVGFGQNFTMEHESLNKLMVSANVVHTEANNHLNKIICTSPMTETEQSESTQTDRILEVIQFTQQQ